MLQRMRNKSKQKDEAVTTIRLTDSADLAQLLLEVETTSACKHPNLVLIREVFQGAATLDIVMDLATGGEVAAMCAGADTHSERKSQGIMQQVCAGLACLHGRGVPHRNIRPHSIVYADETRTGVKLADFAFGAQHAAAAVRALAVGSGLFVAPELLRPTDGCGDCGGAPLALPVDVWAVGVFAHLMLFGLLPHAPQGRLLAELRPAAREPWSSPPDLAGDLSPEALQFIQACLRQEPPGRPTASAALRQPWFSRPAGNERLARFETWQWSLRRSLRELAAPPVAQGEASDQAAGSTSAGEAEQRPEAPGEEAAGAEAAAEAESEAAPERGAPGAARRPPRPGPLVPPLGLEAAAAPAPSASLQPKELEEAAGGAGGGRGEEAAGEEAAAAAARPCPRAARASPRQWPATENHMALAHSCNELASMVALLQRGHILPEAGEAGAARS